MQHVLMSHIIWHHMSCYDVQCWLKSYFNASCIMMHHVMVMLHFVLLPHVMMAHIMLHHVLMHHYIHLLYIDLCYFTVSTQCECPSNSVSLFFCCFVRQEHCFTPLFTLLMDYLLTNAMRQLASRHTIHSLTRIQPQSGHLCTIKREAGKRQGKW